MFGVCCGLVVGVWYIIAAAAVVVVIGVDVGVAVVAAVAAVVDLMIVIVVAAVGILQTLACHYHKLHAYSNQRGY